MTDPAMLVTPATVRAGVPVRAKKPLLTLLGGLVANATGLDAGLIAERLAAREKIGSTGFGAGVAIPHAKIDGLTQVVGGLVQLTTPIEFGAVDGLPVDLVFVLLSPVGAGAEHLKALAGVSRRLRDRNFVEKLRGAGSSDALYAVFAGE
ncbi:MAG TPA: PTS sugar transporter subunit IIA [Sphingomicrobium sp.]